MADHLCALILLRLYIRNMQRPSMMLLLLATLPYRVLTWVINSPYMHSQSKAYSLPNTAEDIQWNGPGSFDLDMVALRWSRPASADSREGLGGGISWALSPNFCKRIAPYFRAETFMFGTIRFMDCNALRSAISDAFDTWGSNHPDLTFYDMSDTCVEVDEGYPVCAQVVLQFTDFEGSMGDLAAAVTVDLADVTREPRSTAGKVIHGGIGLRRASIMFSSKRCWYLDATFCAPFHEMMVGGIELFTILRAVLLFVFATGVVYTLSVCIEVAAAAVGLRGDTEMVIWVMHMCFGMCCGCLFRGKVAWLRSQRAERKERDSHSHKYATLLEFASRLHMGRLLLALLAVVFCPVFYIDVCLPCVECESFTATAAHELGHMIGFHHPDQFDSLNLKSIRNPSLPHGLVQHASSNSSYLSCMSPLDQVAIEPMSTRDEERRWSIMHSVAKHRSRVCLTKDDMEGLHYLYPTCGDLSRHPEPSCTQPIRVAGYLRLLAAVSLPYGTVTIVIICSLLMIRSSQSLRTDTLRAQRQHANRQAKWLKASIAGINIRRANGIFPRMKRRHDDIGRRAKAAMARSESKREMGEAVKTLWGARRLSAEPVLASRADNAAKGLPSSLPQPPNLPQPPPSTNGRRGSNAQTRTSPFGRGGSFKFDGKGMGAIVAKARLSRTARSRNNPLPSATHPIKATPVRKPIAPPSGSSKAQLLSERRAMLNGTETPYTEEATRSAPGRLPRRQVINTTPPFKATTELMSRTPAAPTAAPVSAPAVPMENPAKPANDTITELTEDTLASRLSRALRNSLNII